MALPIINLSLIPTFPARVFGSGPVTIVKTGLDFTFGWDITTYSLNPAPNPAQLQVLGYDPATGSTELYNFPDVFADLTITASQISDSTATGRSVLTGNAATGRGALGLGALATLGAGSGLTSDGTDLALNLDAISSTRGVTLYRGASAWTALSPGTNGQIMRTNGAGADPSWSSISGILDTISSTRGTVLYRGASGWAALAPGTAGHSLKTGGAGANPSWSAAGKVLQVVQTVDTTNRSTTSTSYTSTGISAAITPASTSNTVRITAVFNAGASASLIGRFAIFRGATNLTPGGKNSMATYRPVSGDETAGLQSFVIDFIDAPATTSATTYTLQWLTNTGTVYLGRRGADTAIDTVSGVLTLEEILP